MAAAGLIISVLLLIRPNRFVSTNQFDPNSNLDPIQIGLNLIRSNFDFQPIGSVSEMMNTSVDDSLEIIHPYLTACPHYLIHYNCSGKLRSCKTAFNMAMSNAWGAAQAVTIAQFHHSICSHNKSLDLNSLVFDRSRSWRLRCKFSPSSRLRHDNVASRRRSSRSYFCRCGSQEAAVGQRGSDCSNWDWNRWNRHFEEVEQAENLASVLKFQLEEAIEKEDFEEAIKLKRAIAETMTKDTVAGIMLQLKNAVEEERYNDASSLSRHTGSGLVGWWVGFSKDSDDPFGRLVRITPGVGRFIGRSYTPRQLVTSSPGTPLFEIYVVRDADDSYVMQVVCLQQAKKSLANSSTTQPISATDSSTKDADQESVVDITMGERKTEKSKENAVDIEEATEEGIRSVINFLKDKIPELKVKVVNVDVTEIIEESNAIEQMMQDDDVKSESDDMSEDEAIYVDQVDHDGVIAEAADSANDKQSKSDFKLFVGGVVHNTEDVASRDEYSRLPAEIRDLEKNTFVLHVPGITQYQDASESKISKVKVATIAAQGVSELMPPDVAKAFFSADKVSSKVSKEVREIIKLAVSQAQKRNRLAEETSFSRITPPKSDLDPFDGLYVGAFGPYGTEVVQLKRKFGHWNADDKGTSNDLDFFEYVEAVKLTGDLNVPAGQVSFRAKIGRGKRNPNRGLYPDELGVVASYKGQGRIAEFGFKNPQWVDGELLQLNGKGLGPYVKGGADLGFLFSVPEQSFLVLFSRLKLPE
uniref:Uncharacterized protein n=1 Tax=Kalanchoe fedtschenkoi TaxID=63787 RepID=A0A7N0TZX6_KALFE